MSGNNIQLTVTLDAKPDTDAEDLERLTRQLRDELSELDVQADLMTGGSAPANTKAGDVIEWGTLLLTLAASGGVQELLKDQAHAHRGIRGGKGVVDRPR